MRNKLFFALHFFCVLWVCLGVRTAAAESPAVSELLVPTGEELDSLLPLKVMRIGHIELLSYSHDGQLLATVEESSRVCLWRVASALPVRCLPPAATGRVTALGFTHDDRALALGNSDGSIELRGTVRELPGEPCHLQAPADKSTSARPITSLLFPSHEDSLLAFGAKGDTGRLWKSPLANGVCRLEKNLQRSDPMAEKAPLAGVFEATVIDPTGKYLAVVTGAALGVWNARSGEKLWSEEKLPSPVLSMAISPDAKYLATGFLDGGICLFEIRSGQMRQLSSPHTKAIRAIAFAPDGHILAAGSDERIISVWDLQNTKGPRLLSRRSGITALTFRPDGAILAAASEDIGITLWETANYEKNQVLNGNADWIRSIAFSTKGALLATASDDHSVRVWERRGSTESGPEWSLRCRGEPQIGIVRAVAFHPPDSRLLVAAGESRRIRLLRSSDCSLLPELIDVEASSDWQRSVAFSTDGRWLATGSDDGTISVWEWDEEKNPEKWSFRRRLIGHRDAVYALAFNPTDSTLLASGSYDKSVRLWNVLTGALTDTLEQQSAGVRALAINSTGTMLAVAAGQEVGLWPLAERRLIGKLAHTQVVSALRFSTDGNLLATAERKGRLRLWNVATQKEQSTAELQPDSDPESVLALAVDPKSGAVAAAVLGRVLFRQLQVTPQVQTMLWQGNEGWAVWTSKPEGGTLFRSDMGSLLWRQGPSRFLAPLDPLRPSSDPQLQLKVNVEPGDGAWDSGTAVATIENAKTAGPALWLLLDITNKPGDIESQNRSGRPADYMRLAPGATAQLRVPVPVSKHWGLPPRRVKFCLTISPRYGSRQTICQAVGIGPGWWQHSPELLIALLILGIGIWLLQHSVSRRILVLRPIVQATLAGHNPLAALTLHDYPAVERLLRRTTQFAKTRNVRPRALAAAGIDESRWHRALTVTESAEACAAQLAESLMVRLDNPLKPIFRDDHFVAFRITLPPLSIYVSDDCALIICKSTTIPPHSALVRCKPDALQRPRFAVVVDLTPMQPSAEEVKQALAIAHPATIFVVLSEDLLRKVVLAESVAQAKDLLRVAILEQCTLAEILPYHPGGNGMTDAELSTFFGRRSELAQLLDIHPQNFLLVGPRKMGKSSLLKVLRRELVRRYPNARVLMYVFIRGSLQDIVNVDPALRAETPEEFYKSVLGRTQERQIFLLDEADEFLKQDRLAQYGFCNVMRALSGQGRASFVLAGYQQLHEAMRTSDHPLCNFGELLRLGPLDRQEAANMILEPLTALGLRFVAESETVAWLCEQTACRPHLLAQACSAIVHLRKPLSSQPISGEEVQAAVLLDENISKAFVNWDPSTDDATKDDVTDCAVLRAALLLERSTRRELQKFLQAQGVDLSVEQIDCSVTRLYDRDFALLADAAQYLFCPVPILRHFLSNPQPDSPAGHCWSSAEERLRGELAQAIQRLQTGLLFGGSSKQGAI